MTKEHPTYADRIVRDPQILVGKPVIKGTRIPVQVILEYLAHNPNVDELFADYPRLTIQDVKACFEYAQLEREEHFAVIDRMQAAFCDITPEEIEREAQRSVAAARERRRQRASGAIARSA